jgi:hypothetical protein
MACVLNLTENKYHFIATLTPELKKESFFKIDSTLYPEPVVISFNNDSLFTEGSPAKLSFEQLESVRTDNQFLINDKVVLRLSCYEEGHRDNRISNGLACIVVKTNEDTGFTVDGQPFYICEPTSQNVQGVQVNKGSTIIETAYNIASQINRYCTRIYATAISNYVMLSEKYPTSLQGNVRMQCIFRLTSSFPSVFEFKVVTTQKDENNNTICYKFEGVINGAESTDIGTPVIENGEAVYTINFTIYEGNYTDSFNSLQRVVSMVKVVGLCDSFETTITLYCSDIVFSIEDYSGSSLDILRAVNKVNIVTVDGYSLLSPEYVNIDGFEDKSIIAQIASEIYSAYPELINEISFSGRNVFLTAEEENIPEIRNFISCVHYDYEDKVESTPILDSCVSYLVEQLNNANIEARKYEEGEYSVEIKRLETETVDASDDIDINYIGSKEYPSSETSPMSTLDFKKYFEETTGYIDLVVYRGDESVQQAPKMLFENLDRSIDINLIFADKYPEISNTIFAFNNCSNVNINVLRSRINLIGSELLNFNTCSGKVSIDTCEFLISNSALVIDSNGCNNFELSNKFNSFLVSSKSAVTIFHFNNDYITLTTFGNVIEKQYDDGSCTFYNFNGSVGRITVNDGSSDVCRDLVTYYDNSSFFRWPKNNKTLTSDRKILCGIDDTFSGTDKQLVREWSFNPVADSMATMCTKHYMEDNIRPGTMNVNNSLTDIFGRPRKLSKFYGNSTFTINNNGSAQLTENDFISIDGSRYYFTEYLDLESPHGNPYGGENGDGVNNEELAKICANVILYKANINAYAIYFGMLARATLVVCGFHEIKLSSNLANFFDITDDSITYIPHNARITEAAEHKYDIEFKPSQVLSPEFSATKYIIDYGARQMHTDYDCEFYVDTTGDSFESDNIKYREGTEEDKFFCKDMMDMVNASYPRFGNTKFILYGVATEPQVLSSFDLTTGICSSDDPTNWAVMYGDVTMTSTFRGLREVPVFIADTDSDNYLFKIGCVGNASFTFDNIMVVTTNTLTECELDKPETIISINNGIAKSLAGKVINANNCPLKIFESTIIGQDTNVIECLAALKFEANVYGLGSLNYHYEDNKYYNAFINDTKIAETNYRIHDASDNCLQNEAIDFTDISNADILDFELNNDDDNGAVNLIPNVYSLTLYNPTSYMDIGGRYRCKENEKTSIDAGAIEKNLVDADTTIYYVNLSNAPVTDHGNATYISWEDFRNKIEALDEIKNNYEIHLSGYANGVNPLVIGENVAFYEQACLHFIADKDCIFEGETFLDVKCNYANIIIEGLTSKTIDSFIKSTGSSSNILMVNCFNIFKYIDNPPIISRVLYVFENVESVNMLSCSMMVSNNDDTFFSYSGTKNLCCIACCAQGIDLKNDFGYSLNNIIVSNKGKLYCNNINNVSGDTCIEASEAILDISLCSDDKPLTSESSKLLYEEDYIGFAIIKNDIENSDLYPILKEGMSLSWNRDIDYNPRPLTLTPIEVDSENLDTVYFDNKLYCSPGCYNSITENESGFYSDNPNREITCITEIGRTMITKMLSNIVRFKIEGFAICSDGYDFINPVMSIKSEYGIKRENIKITATANNYTGVSVKIGSVSIPCEGTSKREVVENLVKSINKISPVANSDMDSSLRFGAYIEDINEGTFIITKIMPAISDFYSDDNDGLEFDPDYFTTEVINPSSEYNPDDCIKNQAFPDSGIMSFTDIEYLPLALSLYYKIDRTQWYGGFGREVVLARVTECAENPNLVNYVFPLCICDHGLITKGRDSFVTGRIIIQL